jgi:hypothetical protein
MLLLVVQQAHGCHVMYAGLTQQERRAASKLLRLAWRYAGRHGSI